MIDSALYSNLRSYLDANGVTLVAVSKTHPTSKVMEIYSLGQRVFGENRVQELIEKAGQLPEDISWHLIGHLQRNKVRQVVGVVSMIESVDSVRLLREIQKEAASAGLVVNVLLQVKIASEETKYGFDPETIVQELEGADLHRMDAVRFCGVMGMASFVDDESRVRTEFASLRKHFTILREGLFSEYESFRQISMGMSGDYEIAVEEGSTMVRIGSLLFGARE